MLKVYGTFIVLFLPETIKKQRAVSVEVQPPNLAMLEADIFKFLTDWVLFLRIPVVSPAFYYRFGRACSCLREGVFVRTVDYRRIMDAMGEGSGDSLLWPLIFVLFSVTLIYKVVFFCAPPISHLFLCVRYTSLWSVQCFHSRSNRKVIFLPIFCGN